MGPILLPLLLFKCFGWGIWQMGDLLGPMGSKHRVQREFGGKHTASCSFQLSCWCSSLQYKTNLQYEQCLLVSTLQTAHTPITPSSNGGAMFSIHLLLTWDQFLKILEFEDHFILLIRIINVYLQYSTVSSNDWILLSNHFVSEYHTCTPCYYPRNPLGISIKDTARTLSTYFDCTIYHDKFCEINTSQIKVKNIKNYNIIIDFQIYLNKH